MMRATTRESAYAGVRSRVIGRPAGRDWVDSALLIESTEVVLVDIFPPEYNDLSLTGYGQEHESPSVQVPYQPNKT